MSKAFIHTSILETVKFNEFAPIALSQMTIGVRLSTKKDLESRLNRLLLPHFGELQVREITSLLIERWQSDLTASKGGDITRRTKQLLKNILNRAIVHGIIKDNPINPTSKIKDVKKETREVYTKDEIKMMLNNSKGWLRLFILTMVSLGLRSGEMVGIKFSDIDWENRKIHIQRNIKFGKFSLPKNGLKRWVDIPITLLEELKYAYKNRVNINPELKDYYIFITPKKQYWSDSSSIIKNHFKPLLARLDIEYKTLYSLRHTYATLSLLGKQRIEYISKQLGHKDIKVTYDYYIKYLFDVDDLQRADNILSFS